MNSNNFVNLIGRVGQVPQRRDFDGGGSVLELSVATNRYYKDRGGNRVKETQWHRVKAYQPGVVDTLERYVQRGDQISIVGNLRYREWTDKYDQKRMQTEIVLDSFTFLDNGRRSESNDRPSDRAEPSNNPINAGNPSPVDQPRVTYAGTIDEPVGADLEGSTDLPF